MDWHLLRTCIAPRENEARPFLAYNPSLLFDDCCGVLPFSQTAAGGAWADSFMVSGLREGLRVDGISQMLAKNVERVKRREVGENFRRRYGRKFAMP